MNDDVKSITCDISLQHLPAFMVNFTITFNCNLDCSYCTEHDNSAKHNNLELCKQSIDFIFQYVDIVLMLKHKHERRVALNLIGGEPFSHPDIVPILEYIANQYQDNYKDRWKLSTCITTNGLIGDRALKKVIDLIDFWTVSYHTETLEKQKELTLSTITTLHENNQHLEVRVLAPNAKEKFDEAQKIHSMLISQGINALFKPIHDDVYTSTQTEYFKVFWITKNKNQITNYNTSNGITCCTNRPLILNGDKVKKTNFIPINNFHGWYCALNLNFLSVDHLLDVYHNNSCHVSSLSNLDEPIGTVFEYKKILDILRSQVQTNSVPVVKCPKNLCFGCGMCATKAQNKEDFTKLLEKHLVDTSIIKF